MISDGHVWINWAAYDRCDTCNVGPGKPCRMTSKQARRKKLRGDDRVMTEPHAGRRPRPAPGKSLTRRTSG